MGRTTIEWTHGPNGEPGYTFNPWVGCTKVSEACRNCYAEALMDQRMGRVRWGPGQPRSRTSNGNWRKPHAWNREAEGEHRAWRARVLAWAESSKCEASVQGKHLLEGAICLRCADFFPEPAPERPRVFCASLADWLDHEVPIEWLAELLAVIEATPYLNWLLLTKRPQLWRERMQSVSDYGALRSCAAGKGAAVAISWLAGEPPLNVWIGCTIEDQATKEIRLPEVLKIPAALHFLSVEPLLSAIDFGPELDQVQWVIVGGESGKGARPMHPAWVRDIRSQCYEAGADFFFKQWGAWVPAHEGPAMRGKAFSTDLSQNWVEGVTTPFHRWPQQGLVSVRVGKKAAGREFEGRVYDDVPYQERVA